MQNETISEEFETIRVEQNEEVEKARTSTSLEYLFAFLTLASFIGGFILFIATLQPIILIMSVIFFIIFLICGFAFQSIKNTHRQKAAYLYDRLQHMKDTYAVIKENAKQEDNIKSNSFKEIVEMYKDGYLDDEEFKKAKDKILEQ